MKIGTTSMVFWQTGLSEGIQTAARLGFDSIEIWISHFQKETGLSAAALAELLEQSGMSCTIHAPILDINIASVNAGIRRESTAQQIEAVELCATLGGELVVIHPGQLSSKRSDPDKHWKHQADSYVQILEAAQAQGVIVTVENMEWNKENELIRTASDIKRLQGMIGDYHLPVTLDITHLADTARCIDAIDTLGDSIVHVHVSDFGEKNHIALGDGILDLKKILQKLQERRFDGILSFEIFIPGSAVTLGEQRDKLLALL
ncbi:sugar phosphate isomerase/epimerase [Candidatus Bipolaricaulota bacterium]|nr:sugar phosphate isomerase/epimerase [Candidatus Bipolaricaulota bacterium]TFH10115.1 MAG: sugar phosphate isomerase/epimerase [Candidatus Atribacteria bacterium]